MQKCKIRQNSKISQKTESTKNPKFSKIPEKNHPEFLITGKTGKYRGKRIKFTGRRPEILTYRPVTGKTGKYRGKR